MSSSVLDLNALMVFCGSLDFRERKALITLARSQSIPDSNESPESFFFHDSLEDSRPGRFDVNMQSWRYRRYVDLDDVNSAGLYGFSRDWVHDGLSGLRSSLSPEPDMDLDY